MGKFRTANVGLAEIHVIEPGLLKSAAGSGDLAKIGLAEARVRQARVGKHGPPEGDTGTRCFGEIGSREPSASEVGARQVSAGEVRASQIDALKIPAVQLCAIESGFRQVGV